MEFYKLLVNLNQHWCVSDLIRVVWISNIDAVKILVQSIDDEIALLHLHHILLVAGHQKLLAAFQFLVHNFDEFVSVRGLLLDCFESFLLIGLIIYADLLASLLPVICS